MSNWAEGWTRGGWASKEQMPIEAREVYRIANKAKRRLSKLNKQIDSMREHNDMSRSQKEKEIIALYLERTSIYERAVTEMRGPYMRWQREN